MVFTRNGVVFEANTTVDLPQGFFHRRIWAKRRQKRRDESPAGFSLSIYDLTNFPNGDIVSKFLTGRSSSVVEQLIRNHQVGSSNLPSGSIFQN
jgi:hypothetical protein